MSLEYLEDFTLKAKEAGVYPVLENIIGPSCNPTINIDNKEFISFSSNNYLGLAQHPEVIEVAQKALEKYGLGPASARLISGNLDVYERLEKKMAKFLGYQDCIIFSSGYLANIGTISSITDPPYAGLFSFFQEKIPFIIISDELNHASIIDGCRLSRSKKFVFKHNDCDSLREILESTGEESKLIIIDGVYSMDGDIAPLNEIVKLAKQYNSVIMIDDAHATGVLGKNGLGTFEYFNLKPSDIDLLMGTFVKAFGTVGGFICGNSGIIDYIRVSARPFVFSICIPPACAEATIKVLELIENKPEIREKLWENTEYLRSKLIESGFNTLNSQTQIIPILIGDEQRGVFISSQLYEKGIFAPCVRWPAVLKGMSRLRISVMATHTKEQLNFLIKALLDLKDKFEL